MVIGNELLVTGGYVYRDKKWTALKGWYLFGDYCSGEIFRLKPPANGLSPVTQEPTGFSSNERGITTQIQI